MRKRFLSTGAFAKLCRTTKETIFHYDRVGLLKPHHVSEAGYRYYEAGQYLDFDLISAFKDMGSSLQEIRHHLEDGDPQRMLAFVQEKRAALEQEMRRLEQRRLLLADMACCLEELAQTALDTVVLDEQAERTLLTFPIAGDGEQARDSLSYARAFCAYVDALDSLGIVPRWPYGVLAEADAGAAFVETRFFSVCEDREELARALAPDAPGNFECLVQQAGTYAHLVHVSDGEDEDSVIRAFLQELDRRHYILEDDIVSVSGMQAYTRSQTRTRYACKFSVRVRSAAASSQP